MRNASTCNTNNDLTQERYLYYTIYKIGANNLIYLYLTKFYMKTASIFLHMYIHILQQEHAILYIAQNYAIEVNTSVEKFIVWYAFR